MRGTRGEDDSDCDGDETIPMLCEFLALSSIPASPTYFHSIVSINTIEKSETKKNESKWKNNWMIGCSNVSEKEKTR